MGVLLPIPIRAVPPPIKYKLFFSSMLVPICAIGIIDVSDFIDIPFLTVIKPEILASPTISSETLGSLVPIPRRVLVSSLYIYILFAILFFVPNCTCELIFVPPSILTSPTISNLDFGFVLPIPTFPEGDIHNPI